MQLFAAIGYARVGKPTDAWRLWDRADEAAEVLGPAHHNNLTMFGQANIGIYAVAIDIETGKAGSGLNRARRVDQVAVPSSNRRAQHKLNVARGHWTRGEKTEAADALVASEQDSTETILYSPVARTIVIDLLGSAKRGSDRRLIDLAHRMRAL